MSLEIYCHTEMAGHLSILHVSKAEFLGPFFCLLPPVTLPCPHANASITAEEKCVLFPLAIHTEQACVVGVSEGIWPMPLFETRVSCVPCPHSLVRYHGMMWPLAKRVRLSALGLSAFDLDLQSSCPSLLCAGLMGGHHHT